MNNRTENEEKRSEGALLQKLRSRVGTTLVEMLVVLGIMTVLGGAITTGIGIASKVYTSSVRTFEKDTLFSTLQYVISYELQYSTSVTVDYENNEVIDVQAKTYGEKDYSVDEIHRSFFADGNNRIVYGIEDSGDSSDYQPILSKNAYPDGMGATIDSLVYDPETHYFHVTMSILYKGKSILDSVGFDVLNLYGTEPKYA